MLVAAVALTSCVGIGAVTEGSVVREAQARGGGITTDLVDEAIAEVAAATGQSPLEVHAITATLARVEIVVPAAGGGRDTWTYGTSGVFGGKGLEGPEPELAPAFAFFPVEAGQVDVDALAAAAREEAGGAGRWVESVTIARPADGAEPVTTVVVTDGGVPSNVMFDAAGQLVLEGQEGPR